MKKFRFIGSFKPVFVVLMAGIALVSLGCASMDLSLLQKRPSAKLKKLDIKEISFQDITFLFDVEINNPYPMNINLNALKAKFLVEKRQVLDTQTGQGLTIRGNGSETSQLLVNLKYKDLEQVVRAYQSKDYLQTDIIGEIVIDLPKLGIPNFPKVWSIPFSISKKIPAIKPVVRIKNFKVKQPSAADIAAALKAARDKLMKPENVAGFMSSLLSGKKPQASQIINPQDLDLKLRVSFDIELENKTAAGIAFRKLRYNFFLQNEPLVNGNTMDIQKQGKKLILHIDNEFSTKALSKSLMSAFQKRNATFVLTGGSELILPASIKKDPVPLKINENGSFRF